MPPLTKQQALEDGFCGHCAAFFNGRWHCGVISLDHHRCGLPDDVQKRWRRKLRLARGKNERPVFGQRKEF